MLISLSSHPNTGVTQINIFNMLNKTVTSKLSPLTLK